MNRRRETFECPHCGGAVPIGRPACPHCGSDERTGWKSEEEIQYQSVEIPDFLPPDEELTGAGPHRRFSTPLWVVAIALFTAFLIALLW